VVVVVVVVVVIQYLEQLMRFSATTKADAVV
jgi:hypothetical protein